MSASKASTTTGATPARRARRPTPTSTPAATRSACRPPTRTACGASPGRRSASWCGRRGGGRSGPRSPLRPWRAWLSSAASAGRRRGCCGRSASAPSAARPSCAPRRPRPRPSGSAPRRPPCRPRTAAPRPRSRAPAASTRPTPSLKRPTRSWSPRSSSCARRRRSSSSPKSWPRSGSSRPASRTRSRTRSTSSTTSPSSRWTWRPSCGRTSTAAGDRPVAESAGPRGHARRPPRQRAPHPRARPARRRHRAGDAAPQPRRGRRARARRRQPLRRGVRQPRLPRRPRQRRRPRRRRSSATSTPSAGEAEVVPQELGRVLINLLSNAFHAVGPRRKAGEPGYAPAVTVRTRRGSHGGRTVEIRVDDNGPGMPDAVLAPHLRAVLHDQAGRRGHGPRAVARARHRRAGARRHDDGRERGGRGDGLYDSHPRRHAGGVSRAKGCSSEKDRPVPFRALACWSSLRAEVAITAGAHARSLNDMALPTEPRSASRSRRARGRRACPRSKRGPAPMRRPCGWSSFGKARPSGAPA